MGKRPSWVSIDRARRWAKFNRESVLGYTIRETRKPPIPMKPAKTHGHGDSRRHKNRPVVILNDFGTAPEDKMAEHEGPRMDEFIGRTDWFDPALSQEQFDAMVDKLAADQTNSVRCEQLTRMVKNMRAAVAQWNKAYESEPVDVDMGDDNG